jgi:hypothetical protein
MATDQWHTQFYSILIQLAALWKRESQESHRMVELLSDPDRLDAMVEEAMVTHLPPEAAARQFIEYWRGAG